MSFSLVVCLMLILPISIFSSSTPSFPIYAEQFSVKLLEFSAEGNQVLNETIYWDLSARRTHLKAEGPLVGDGILEQIMRCDIPEDGFFVNAGSTTENADPSEWECTNTTIKSDPASCQLANFWVLPERYTYIGEETINGVDCGKFEYREGRNIYNFWGTDEAPCAAAQLTASAAQGTSAEFLWRMEFSDFVAAPPSFPEDFEITTGVECPLAAGSGKRLHQIAPTFPLGIFFRGSGVARGITDHETAVIHTPPSVDLSHEIVQRKAAQSGDTAAAAQHKIFLASNQSVVISWITDDNSTATKNISWGIEASALTYSTIATSTTSYSTTDGSYQSGFIHAATIPVKWLSTYFYSTDGGETVLEFTSPPNPEVPDKPFSFAVVGDLGQTENSERTRDHMMDSGSTFIIHTGDLSYADCNQERWDTYAELMHPLSSRAPWMTIVGNHEIESESDCNNVDSKFEAYDLRYGNYLPFEASGSSSNQFYSFEAAGIHFVMMSSYTDYNQGSPQLEWLKDDLASIDRAKTPFVVGVLHAPWYNSNMHHSNETEEFFFAQSAEDLMHDYKVDLILAGHVHAYERSYPVYHNQVVGPEDGTVYVTCGDGGNREGHAVPWKYPEPEWSAFRRAAFGHGLLTVVNSTAMHWSWRQNLGEESAVDDEYWFTAKDSSRFKKAPSISKI